MTNHSLALGDYVRHENEAPSFHLRHWVGTLCWLDEGMQVGDVEWLTIPRKPEESEAEWRDRQPLYPSRFPLRLLRRVGVVHVVNKYHYQKAPLPPHFILAMQSEGHPLGNPYYQEAQADRPGCLQKFKQWLWQRYQKVGSAQYLAVQAIADLLEAGEDVYLACVCVPLACHCHQIELLIEKVVLPRRRTL